MRGDNKPRNHRQPNATHKRHRWRHNHAPASAPRCILAAATEPGTEPSKAPVMVSRESTDGPPGSC
eukprot:330804-Rhodomonas_salina.1